MLILPVQETVAVPDTTDETAAPSSTSATDSLDSSPKATDTDATKGAGDQLVGESAVIPEQKPFQRLQFLLRDWQNFDTDYEEGQSDAVYQSLRAEMQNYLADVLRTRGHTTCSVAFVLHIGSLHCCGHSPSRRSERSAEHAGADHSLFREAGLLYAASSW